MPFALFRPQEDAAGYFLLLRLIVERHGLPLTLYADWHTIFQSPKKATLEQELAGKYPRSQSGRQLTLVDELGIQLIPAYSPQAKGRIERLFETLQDGLLKALRRSGPPPSTKPTGPCGSSCHRRFRKRPAQPEPAYLPWPDALDPEAVFCFKDRRRACNDNTFAFDGHHLQIPADHHRTNYAGCRVETRQHMDGRLSVWYQGRRLSTYAPAHPGPPQVGEFTPAALATSKPSAAVLQKPNLSKDKSRRPWKPPADHPARMQLQIQAKPTKDPT